ncbi:MAG: Asp-tRNA(Asn)/Glu-tRNA(Gln) amidotransferase GatCAB subunit B, partial [Candidatus Dormibacteraeota bacterium]|nr:Asp-tRNA(Asn)/Glu-tRNA(Gln) amidotransferase GatCAB subunit B [Candidatus Dormibacteraeota bacterium]
IERQVDVLEEGGEVVQETRGWSEAQQRTFGQRSKEEAHDYRYFPEPDLPPLHLDSGWVSQLRQALPELPARKRERFRSQYKLSDSDARLFVEDPHRSRLLEETVAAGAEARITANWIIAAEPKLGSAHLADLLRLIEQGVINRDQGRQVQGEAEARGRPPQEVVQALGLAQVSDEAALAGVIDEVIAAQPKAAADFRAGKQQAVGALLGAVKQATGGTANLKVASRLLRERLSQ